MNLSGLTSIVFGVQGDPAGLQVEFEDLNTNNPSVRVNLTGITAGLQHFQIPTAPLAALGLDLANVQFINFIIDQNQAGSVPDEIGSFDVFVNGLMRKIVIGGVAGLDTVCPAQQAQLRVLHRPG